MIGPSTQNLSYKLCLLIDIADNSLLSTSLYLRKKRFFEISLVEPLWQFFLWKKIYDALNFNACNLQAKYDLFFL